MHDQGRSGYGVRRTDPPVNTNRRSRALFGAKNAFNADNDVVQIWKDQFKEQLRIGFDVLMHLDFVVSVDDAYVHFTDMQIDTTVVLVLSFIKFHRLASFRFGKCLLGVTTVYRCE
jgi:hypothetical protein